MPWVHQYAAGALGHVQNAGRTKNRHDKNDGSQNGNGYWDDLKSVVSSMPFSMGWIDTGMGNPSVLSWLSPTDQGQPIPAQIYLCQTEHLAAKLDSNGNPLNPGDPGYGMTTTAVFTYDIYGNQTYAGSTPPLPNPADPNQEWQHVNYVYSQPYTYAQCVANCMGNLALVNLESGGKPSLVTITSVAWDGTVQTGQVHFCFGYQCQAYPIVSLTPASSDGINPQVGGGQPYLYIVPANTQPNGSGKTGVYITLDAIENAYPAPCGSAMYGYSADWDYEISGQWMGWISCSNVAFAMTFPFLSETYVSTPIGATAGTTYNPVTIPCNIPPPTAQLLASQVQGVIGGYGILSYDYTPPS